MLKYSIETIISIVERTTGFSFKKPVVLIDACNVYVKDGEDAIYIAGKENADYARGLTLYAKEHCSGNRNFELEETRVFSKLAAYFDVSRGGVLKVSSIKKLLIRCCVWVLIACIYI